MSIEALNWALNLQLDKPVWKSVLIGIANHANPNGQAWPSVARLSLYSGFKERAIRTAIKQLIDAGWLHQELRSGTTPLYTLAMEESPPERGTPSVKGRGEVHVVHPNHNRTINNNKRKMQPDWMPTTSMIEFAHANGFDARRVQNEADRFRDYWIGTGKPMADWEATWRNWIRRNNFIQGSRSNGSRQSVSGLAAQNRAAVNAVLGELYQHEAAVAGGHQQDGGNDAPRRITVNHKNST